MNTQELLHEIDKRLSRVEERITDLVPIREKLDKIDARFDVLNTKVSGTAAVVAIISTIAMTLLTKLVLG